MNFVAVRPLDLIEAMSIPEFICLPRYRRSTEPGAGNFFYCETSARRNPRPSGTSRSPTRAGPFTGAFAQKEEVGGIFSAHVPTVVVTLRC